MAVFMVDHLLTKFRGPAAIEVVVDRKLKSVANREAYWAQLADPTAWSPSSHPVLQSADVRMVQCKGSGSQPEQQETEDGNSGGGAVAEGEPTLITKPVPLGQLKPGLGLLLRHKAGDPRAGGFFCTRECVEHETPEDGPWRLKMRTVDVGGGYPFAPNSEESMVQLWPPESDGSMRIELKINASCASRMFRWWRSLDSGSQLGAEMLIDSIEEEVGRSKKKD